MATLSRELRKALERVVLAARGEAESGSRKALDQLAVAHQEPWPTMTTDQQRLRRRLRARGRQLGDRLEDGGRQGVEHLVSQCAYEQWHRMLFARFLAECELLIEPESHVPVSVDECKELARGQGVDWISLASKFAQGMLPQIFRSDDAVLEIALPAEHRQPLEQLLTSLPSKTFIADDSLGWVYQYWQSEEKDRVNKSGEKVGADELPAVTQLFTEDYMVDFLLHNTLGGWWVRRRFPEGLSASSENDARALAALPGVEWRFLRLVQSDGGRWVPAAGNFDGWPVAARNLRVLDPCMGSGHFLVFALPLLAAMRRAEEGLSAAESLAAVLRDNIFGLELDPRCTQIAAFNVALAAWKRGGWQALPPLSVACSGLRLSARREQWMQLAGADDKAARGMEQLYDLFIQADVLGSLINPRNLGEDLLVSGFQELQPLLTRALREEEGDETVHELAVTAQGIAKAAEILAGHFTLVVTNVPYLGRGKQDKVLRDYCERQHAKAKADLATCFLERCLDFCDPNGTAAVVTPQTWLFLGVFKELRRQLLQMTTWNLVSRLGPAAFRDMNWWAATTLLIAISKHLPSESSNYASVSASATRETSEKPAHLLQNDVALVPQLSQLQNPDATVTDAVVDQNRILRAFASCNQGVGTADGNRYIIRFWEVPRVDGPWAFYQMAPESNRYISGCHSLLRWEDGNGSLAHSEYARVCGQPAWGKRGTAISVTGHLYRSLYLGTIFDCTVAALTAKRKEDETPVIRFTLGDGFEDAVRQVDQALSVTESSFLKVPFDRTQWQHLEHREHHEVHTEDPTQWLFSGNPANSEKPLQVAVARLVGYSWPRQTGSSIVDCPELSVDALASLADHDGIACISAIKGEEPAEERLRAVLSLTYGAEWSGEKLHELLVQVNYGGKTVEDWLRNGFFEQHCDLFHERPFVWHVWDGHRDGFSALVNYHKLTKANLEKLAFAYLGEWIARQQAAAQAGEPGGEARLVAAKQLQDELKKILEGEPPYDIFVRWKPLAMQPIGWEPDLRDGVRANIRPFVLASDVGKKGAGILRAKPRIKWDKDRGKEPPRTKEEFPWFFGWDGQTNDFAGGSAFDANRWNAPHYSREFKMTARKRNGQT